MTMFQAGGPGTNNPVSSVKILTIDLGTRKQTDTSFRIPYSDGFLTWGSNTYVYGFDNTAFQLKYDDSNNIKITDYNQDFKDNDFLARIEMWFAIGQRWYYENGHYYLQILGEQFINVENSFSNGYIHTSYGKYIILY